MSNNKKNKRLTSLQQVPPIAAIDHRLISDDNGNPEYLKLLSRNERKQLDKDAKTFPDRKTSIDFGVPFDLRNGQYIIEEYADLLANFYQQFDAIELMPGLKSSLQNSLASAMVFSKGQFRHDKKPKFE